MECMEHGVFDAQESLQNVTKVEEELEDAEVDEAPAVAPVSNMDESTGTTTADVQMPKTEDVSFHMEDNSQAAQNKNEDVELAKSFHVVDEGVLVLEDAAKILEKQLEENDSVEDEVLNVVPKDEEVESEREASVHDVDKGDLEVEKADEIRIEEQQNDDNVEHRIGDLVLEDAAQIILAEMQNNENMQTTDEISPASTDYTKQSRSQTDFDKDLITVGVNETELEKTCHAQTSHPTDDIASKENEIITDDVNNDEDDMMDKATMKDVNSDEDFHSEVDEENDERSHDERVEDDIVDNSSQPDKINDATFDSEDNDEDEDRGSDDGQSDDKSAEECLDRGTKTQDNEVDEGTIEVIDHERNGDPNDINDDAQKASMTTISDNEQSDVQEEYDVDENESSVISDAVEQRAPCLEVEGDISTENDDSDDDQSDGSEALKNGNDSKLNDDKKSDANSIVDDQANVKLEVELDEQIPDRDSFQESTTSSSTTFVKQNDEETLVTPKHVFDDANLVLDTEITCSVVTWNLAESSPSESDAAFIKDFRKVRGNGSDFVLFGGQETENTKPRRMEGSRSRELRRILIKMLGKKYVPLALHSLGGVQFALFCKRSIVDQLEHVSIADVACGIGNVFHNKGAIGAFVQMKARDVTGEIATKRSKSVKMLFVACHLAAHVKKVDARNADYWRIVSELEAQAPPSFLGRRRENSQLDGGEHLLNSVDHVIFCGDLNYRVDLPREFTMQTLKKMNPNDNPEQSSSRQLRMSLLRHDQLLRTISEGRAFVGMSEGEITFPPTFKFDKGTQEYDTQKQRIPAWTDRILFKPNGVRVHDYNSVQDATHSDHRPVYATLGLNIVGKEMKSQTSVKRKKKHRSTRDKSA